jgi:hypothetical protein
MSVAAPVRLLGAHVVWQVLWTARNPVPVPRTRTAPQVDLRGRTESGVELDRD